MKDKFEIKDIFEMKDSITAGIKNEIDTVKRAQKIMTTMMIFLCFTPLLIILAFILGKQVGKRSERRKAKRRDRRKHIVEKGIGLLKKKDSAGYEDAEELEEEDEDEFDFEDNDFMFVD